MICSLEQHRELTSRLAKKLDAAVYETHISTVLVANGHAWKLKKPVDLGFLDFSTLEKRRFCCEEEIRLNSRLAPDIYQKVVPITGSLEEPEINGRGEVIEHAVQMREFPADALLANDPGLLNPSVMDDLARQVALFQKEAAIVDQQEPLGTPEAILAPMEQNFEQILAQIIDGDEVERLDRLRTWTLDAYDRLRPVLEKRHATGRIREGHGDMHLGNIAMEQGRYIIFDGIEFNPNLRWIDVVSEIAFLMMDLDRFGKQGLSQRFLNGWLAWSGDFEALELLRFYQVYRAMVRAKIAVLRLAQELSDSERAEAIQAFGEYLALAEKYTGPASPVLFITTGPSGSGKSVVTRSLFGELPVIQVASDIERKRLAGFDPLDRTDSGPGAGIYTPQMGERTYQRLLELSELVVRAGFSPVADATFLKQRQRSPFLALSRRLGVPFLILEMKTPVDELRRRVKARHARGDDPAEADLAILESQLASAESLTPEEQRFAFVISPEVANSDHLAEQILNRLQS